MLLILQVLHTAPKKRTDAQLFEQARKYTQSSQALEDIRIKDEVGANRLQSIIGWDRFHNFTLLFCKIMANLQLLAPGSCLHSSCYPLYGVAARAQQHTPLPSALLP